jgi:hypothetical protein
VAAPARWQAECLAIRYCARLPRSKPTHDSVDFDDDDVGGAWGHVHERSALATYLTGFLLLHFQSACMRETGYWPLSGLKELWSQGTLLF